MGIRNNRQSKGKNLSPLRVVHVVAPSFGYGFSGTTKHILRLLREWQLPGVELSLWGTSYLDHAAGPGELWTKTIRHTRWVRLSWSIRLLWMLFRQRRHYDSIHVHTLWWGGLLAPLMTRLLGKRSIYEMSLFGSDTPSALGKQSLGGLKVSLFKLYDGVIGLTPELVDDCQRNNLSSKLLVLPGFLVFVPPALPSTVRRIGAREKMDVPNQSPVLLFVGTTIRRKGFDLLTDLFVRLTESYPDLRMLVVGAHNVQENPRLDAGFVATQTEKLERAELASRVIWKGLVSDETELLDCYLASDIFVFPTRAEGQGHVILEAMGCGLTVVCSNLPGVTDVMVTQDETGFLVDVDDLDGFATAVTRLLDDPALRQNMGMAGRTRAITEFGFDTYCRTLADFYELVVAEPASTLPPVPATDT